MYRKIADPENGKTYDINSKRGKNLIGLYIEYLKQTGGARSVCEQLFRMMTRRGQVIPPEAVAIQYDAASGEVIQCSGGALWLCTDSLTIVAKKPHHQRFSGPRPGRADPQDPFIYEARIEVGLNAGVATHVVLLRYDDHCEGDTIKDIIETGTAGAPSEGTFSAVHPRGGGVNISCYFLGTETVPRNIPTIKLLNPEDIDVHDEAATGGRHVGVGAGSGEWRHLQGWVKNIHSWATDGKKKRGHGYEKVYQTSASEPNGLHVIRDEDGGNPLDYIIVRNNTNGFEGDRRLLIFYTLNNFKQAHDNRDRGIDDDLICLTSIRNLTQAHLPLLQHSIHTAIELISSGGAHPAFTNFLEYKCYFHYQPSTWVLHLHVVHRTCSDTDSEFDKTFLLSDVIRNIGLFSEYYSELPLVILDRTGESAMAAPDQQHAIWDSIFHTTRAAPEVARRGRPPRGASRGSRSLSQRAADLAPAARRRRGDGRFSRQPRGDAAAVLHEVDALFAKRQAKPKAKGGPRRRDGSK